MTVSCKLANRARFSCSQRGFIVGLLFLFTSSLSLVHGQLSFAVEVLSECNVTPDISPVPVAPIPGSTIVAQASAPVCEIVLVNATEGALKHVALMDAAFRRLKTGTHASGAFLLGARLPTDTLLLFANGRWRDTRDSLIWFPDVQVDNGALTATDTGVNATLGAATAFDGEALTLASGAPGDEEGQGAVVVFARASVQDDFIQQGPKLAVSDGPRFQGASVALSADGNTLAVGAPGDGSVDIGGVFVWTRSPLDAAWTLVNPDGIAYEPSDASGLGVRFGASVALDSAGVTLSIGGPGDNNGAGANWIFVFNGSDWLQQGPKLVGSANDGSARQGASVAINVEGTRFVTGGPGQFFSIGAFWVFALDASTVTWIQDGSLLSTFAVGGNEGTSVAMDVTGDRIVAGIPGASAGGASVWDRSSALFVGWMPTAILDAAVDFGAVSGSRFGTSVAISKRGLTIVLGGPQADSSAFSSSSSLTSTSLFAEKRKSIQDHIDKQLKTSREFRRPLATTVSSDQDSLQEVGLSATGGALVYVFGVAHADAWHPESFLISADASGGDADGASIALSATGGILALGSPGAHANNGTIAIFA